MFNKQQHELKRGQHHTRPPCSLFLMSRWCIRTGWTAKIPWRDFRGSWRDGLAMYWPVLLRIPWSIATFVVAILRVVASMCWGSTIGAFFCTSNPYRCLSSALMEALFLRIQYALPCIATIATLAHFQAKALPGALRHHFVRKRHRRVYPGIYQQTVDANLKNIEI